jgi:hypothetical protein
MQVRASLVVAGLAAAACTINGKPVGFSPAAAEADTPAGAAGTAAREEPREEPRVEGDQIVDKVKVGPDKGAGACAAQAWSDAWPYLAKPSDPYAAVVDGYPARVAVPTDTPSAIAASTGTCDAAHDHCLRDCSWLIVAYGGGTRVAHVGKDGYFHDADKLHDVPDKLDGTFVAYRTVPVTKKTVAAGSMVFALEPPRDVADGPMPENWRYGKVAAVDWKTRTFTFEGDPDSPFFLAVARVPVLSYQYGDKVEKVEGAVAKAPAIADLVTPGREPADPWAQVGKDKRPVATAADAQPLATFFANCAGARDHCLRPWVWFVDVDHRPVPARWTGKQFVGAADETIVLTKPGLAYRTRPAKASELKVGARVLVYESPDPPANERSAHQKINSWVFAEITAVDVAGKKVELDRGGSARPMDNVRVLVLFWLDGEKAEAVE